MLCKTIDSFDELNECIDLAEQHYNEVEGPITGLSYSPKKDVFKGLFENGFLEGVMLYDEGVVGYLICSVNDSLLDDSVYASEVGMYVKPEYRGEGYFKDMVYMLESLLKGLGVDRVNLAFKGAGKALDGYIINETFISKRLT